MKKVSYLALQKKYAGKIVALDKRESKVIASGKKFKEVFAQLSQKKMGRQECVYIGPIQKAGTINVYFFPLRAKKNS